MWPRNRSFQSRPGPVHCDRYLHPGTTITPTMATEAQPQATTACWYSTVLWLLVSLDAVSASCIANSSQRPDRIYRNTRSQPPSPWLTGKRHNLQVTACLFSGTPKLVLTYHLIGRSLTLLYWMLIEAPLAVTTICLPPIFFLIKRRFHRLSRSSSRTLGDTGSGERLKSVDSSGLRAGYRDPEKSESWGSSPPDTKDRSSNKPLPTSPASNSPWRLSHLAPRPLPISISKPRRSTEKQHERSRSVPKPRYPPLAPLNDDNGTPTSPPVELSSNLLHPADIQPEYQAMIYTPPVIPGVRRTQEDVQCGMIRVQREVNVEVRDQHSERPLKDMLDTGLGLGRHSGTSGKRDSDGSGKWDSR